MIPFSRSALAGRSPAPLVASLLLAAGASAAPSAEPRLEPAVVLSPASATPLERLAAREVRRYFYARTGVVLPIAATSEAPAILVARRDRAAVLALADQALHRRLDALAAEERLLLTLDRHQPPVLLVTGGSEQGVLYAAYRLAEHLGVRFALHGDTLPDERQGASLPPLDESGRPLFAIRGIQPFHDFPEGPDWWTRDDYKQIAAQLPKLGMNFLGLHTYPEGRPNAEPTVWIGPAAEMGRGSEVKAAYPSSYFTTQRGNWGYDARPTSDYTHGAAALFPSDVHGNDAMEGFGPQPADEAQARALFERAADILKDVFTFARRLGTRTCAGTETPLLVPTAVAARLTAAGQRPGDPAVAQQLYEGIFRRIAQSYPLDFYWLWTPESWTWESVKDADVQATLGDVRSAIAAARAVRAPFALATSGWVLGPPQDPTLFDRELPKDVALSCINRTVGHSPVERGFANVKGRATWAIPWLEDDPALTSPQLWVGRLRRDAADAHRYGTSGLIGIHWRTRAIAPNVAALAAAAWQQDWDREPLPVEGPIGGWPQVRAGAKVEGAPDPDLYRHQRCGLAGYRLPVRNGRYTVTLRFAETELERAGQRVFDVAIEGRTVLANLDLARAPGPGKAFDHVVRDVEVKDGWLDVQFLDRQNVACLAGIEVEGRTTRRVNVGGPALAGYEAEPPGVPFVPTAEFWADWASHEFGPEVGARAAAVFERVDSRLPRPATWVDGPGGLDPDARPWWQAKSDYDFVDELAALRPGVVGKLALERFDYWLESLRMMRAMGELRCAHARLQTALAALRTAGDGGARRQKAEAAFELQRAMVPLVGAVMRHLLASVRTRGELGSVANWQQHVLPRVFEAPAREIADALGHRLGAEAQLPRRYEGEPRLIVPTLRTSLERGEPLRVEALVLGESESVQLLWRPLGTGTWTSVPFERVARGVLRVTLSPPNDDIEYVVQAITSRGLLSVPAAGTESPQTVVLMP